MLEQVALTFIAGVLLIGVARVISWYIAATGQAKALVRIRGR